MASKPSVLPLTESFIPFTFSPSPPPSAPVALPAVSPAVAAASTSGSRNKERETSPSSKSHGKRKERDEDDPEAYRNRKEERRAASRGTPWTEGIDWYSCRNPAEMLNREILAFVEYISPSLTEHATRQHIVALIRRAVTAQWSDAQVLTFGSFETGLYLPTGDIDLVIQSESMDRQNKVTVLHTLASVLRRANLAESIQVIAKAKVPIVKFVSSYGRLPIDISLNQLNGISAGKIVNSYIAALPALKPLVLVIKSFLSQRGMNEVFSGGLGSYSVICLVVSFLQVHPKIRRAEIDPMQNLGVLLIEFFELYGKHFGYDETGISLRDGGTYFSKANRGWQNERQKYLLSVEDPQDPSNDISKSSYGIIRVRSTLAGAYEVLTSRLYIRAQELVNRRSGRGEQLRHAVMGRGDDGAISILVGIMGISPEVTSHRALLGKLFRDGTLQRLLGIPLEIPTNKLPAFAQTTTTPTSPFAGGSSSSRHKRFDDSSEPPSSRNRRSGDRRTVQAIHVIDSDDSDDSDDRHAVQSRGHKAFHSDSDLDFVDEPFHPRQPPAATARTKAISREQSTTSTGVVSVANARPSSAGDAAPARSTKAAAASRRSPSPSESRYATTSRRIKRSRQPSFSPAPSQLLEERAAYVSSDSEEEGEIKELVDADTDAGDGSGESEDSSIVIEGREEIEDSEDEVERLAKRREKRQRRDAKRAFWAAKGGNGGMSEDLRMGGLDDE